jgi:hypothetical protein
LFGGILFGELPCGVGWACVRMGEGVT